jgi:hypothetical protein
MATTDGGAAMRPSTQGSCTEQGQHSQPVIANDIVMTTIPPSPTTMSCLLFDDDVDGGETRQSLFGPGDSDKDEDGNSPICVATPIPQVYLCDIT